MPDSDVQAPQGGDLVLGQGLGAVRRCWPPLDADRRVAVDPALALPPADRLARDGQFPVDGIGVQLVRPRRRQLGQHFRQRRVVDRGDGEDGRLRAPAGGPGRRRFAGEHPPPRRQRDPVDPRGGLRDARTGEVPRARPRFRVRSPVRSPRSPRPSGTAEDFCAPRWPRRPSSDTSRKVGLGQPDEPRFPRDGPDALVKAIATQGGTTRCIRRRRRGPVRRRISGR